MLVSCAPRDIAPHASTPIPPPVEGEVLVGAGDIASCSVDSDEATAKLLDGIPGTVFTIGDNAYPNGSLDDYTKCYGPTWGRHKARTRPAIGNHDYKTASAQGYFAYWGETAGTSAQSWYSYDLGAWHVVVLDSNCTKVGCGPDSPQVAWLKADLAKSAAKCTLAYWHHPRWGAGRPDPAVQAFWDVLHAAGAELVVNGHDHFYERLAPMDPAGKPDAAAGIRQITAGTGGAGLYDFEKPPLPVTEARNDKTFGVLRLALKDGAYDWKFVPVAGSTFSDAGTAACH